jgi:D-alanyl-D-alanine carboxypeptidase (penicillin-binding protein 5/6)
VWEGGPKQPARRTSTTTGPTGITDAYAEIEDNATGSEIRGQSENTEVPMGSITKVMTAIVVLESAGLNRGAGLTRRPLSFGIS